MNRHAIRFALILALMLSCGAAVAYVVGQYFGFEDLKRNREALVAIVNARPLTSILVYMSIVVVASAVLPGVALFKVAAGAIFGFWLGLPVVLVATVLAATVGFTISRVVGRGPIERRFGKAAAQINAGVERDGPIYLLAMRFSPLMPFFLINVGMGLSRMRASTYILYTAIGTLPACIVYINAGVQLSLIDQPSDILSTRMALSLILLSIMPIVGRFAAVWLRRRAAESQA